MYQNMLSILLSLLALPLAAQQFPLTVVAASGYEGTTANGQYSISSTLGEAVTFTFKGTGGTLAQGFHQGDRLRCWTLTGLFPAEILFDSTTYDPCTTTAVTLEQTPFSDFSAQWFVNDLPVCDGWSCMIPVDIGVSEISLLLSADGCELYDNASLILKRGKSANPQPDFIEVLQGADLLPLNLIQNDENLEPDFTLEIINPQPDLIFVTPAQQTPGLVLVGADHRAVGNYSFEYRVCNTGFCQECNTARVDVSVGRLVGEGYNNGITPNGDGLNDIFILCQPCDGCPPCSNMRLWIYNRWGDVVFSDPEYNNDWGGKNADGQDLPAGTYFYYATINKVPRTGSVTIVR